MEEKHEISISSIQFIILYEIFELAIGSIRETRADEVRLLFTASHPIN